MNDENLAAKSGLGRPKGSQNKVSKAAKEVIAEAAAGLGGSERLLAWAKEDPANERAFWATIYCKLVAVTVAGDSENPLALVTRIELVAPGLDDNGAA